MMNKIVISMGQPCKGKGEIHFSPVKSKKRINKANRLLGKKVVKWIIGFVLFLFGATRKDISQLIGTSYPAFNSFIYRMGKDGIAALEDRRFSYDKEIMTPMPPEPLVDIPTIPMTPTIPTVEIQGDEVIIHFPVETHVDIRIPYANKLTTKAVLLTLLQNQILKSKDVANVLDYTQSYLLYLNRQIFVDSKELEVLVNKRQGQKQRQNYIFKPEVKAELIQQCLANSVVGKSTSGKVLASDLKERCGLDISPRSIQYHVQKLGLKNIAHSLPGIIELLKKKSRK